MPSTSTTSQAWFQAQGRYPEAEGLFRQALDIDRDTLGEGHPSTPPASTTFALVVRAQGRYPEAEGLYRQALDIARVTLGEGHPAYATRLNNLAGVVLAQGRYPGPRTFTAKPSTLTARRLARGILSMPCTLATSAPALPPKQATKPAPS
ncbi:MAG: tetratricopeptide repeat protein [Rhodobacter sp.]|nr:tetratricopeptide repeat protein [Rhodobacter sp.]